VPIKFQVRGSQPGTNIGTVSPSRSTRQKTSPENQPLVKLVRTDKVHIEIDVPESAAPALSEGGEGDPGRLRLTRIPQDV
jgi:hypothetical protein